MDVITIIGGTGLALALIIWFLLRLTKRRRAHREVYEIPWVLLLAWRQRDREIRKIMVNKRNKLLTRFDRDDQLTISSLRSMIVTAIEETASVYHPTAEQPMRQLSVKQMNLLMNRIFNRLHAATAVPPLNLLAGVNLGTIQWTTDMGKNIATSEPVQFLMNSPVGGVIKKLPLAKMARFGSKVTKLTPARIALELGKILGEEGGKRLLLHTIASIVHEECIRTFSGGEVFRDKARLQLLALWLASDLISKSESENRKATEWFVQQLQAINNRPDTFGRLLILKTLGSDFTRTNHYSEMYARYRHARNLLPKELLMPPSGWISFFKCESLQALADLPRSEEAISMLRELSDLLDDDQSGSTLKQLLSGLT